MIWNSFEQAVNLITSKEVYVIDCWEPMVFVAKSKGIDAVYADPKEGYLLWAMAAYIVKNPNRSEEQTAAAYAAARFHAGRLVWRQDHRTARIHDKSTGAGICQGQSRRVPRPKMPKKVGQITDNVRRKFQQGGTWQNRWPTEVEFYEVGMGAVQGRVS